MSAKQIPAKRPARQMSEHEIRRIVGSAIRDSMPEFESMVRSVLDERLQSVGASGPSSNASGPAQQARIRKLVEDVYADMDHVRQAYCSDDSYGELKLVITHDDEDRVRVFREACRRAIKLEGLLPDLYIEPHVLHESNVSPYRISNMKAVLEVR